MKIKSYRGEYEVNFTTDFISNLKEVVQEGDVFLFDQKVNELYGDRFSVFEKTNASIITGIVTDTFNVPGINLS